MAKVPAGPRKRYKIHFNDRVRRLREVTEGSPQAKEAAKVLRKFIDLCLYNEWDLADMVEELKAGAVVHLMTGAAKDNQRATAAMLGISRMSVGRILDRHAHRYDPKRKQLPVLVTPK